MEYALEPIRAAVTRMAPEIESACKIRNAHHVDLESYSRRIKALSVKEEALVESGKSEKDGEKSAAAIKLEEDKGKIQIKLNTTKEHYEHHNTKSKADIVDARKVHDDLVDSLFVTTIVCQVCDLMKIRAYCPLIPPPHPTPYLPLMWLGPSSILHLLSSWTHFTHSLITAEMGLLSL
jgi:hypothetical protein